MQVAFNDETGELTLRFAPHELVEAQKLLNQVQGVRSQEIRTIEELMDKWVEAITHLQ